MGFPPPRLNFVSSETPSTKETATLFFSVVAVDGRIACQWDSWNSRDGAGLGSAAPLESHDVITRFSFGAGTLRA